MGNEMGNNNTTGVKEEESLAVEDPKGLSKETSSFDDVKGVIGSDDSDVHEKSNGLASDENQTQSRDEKEQRAVRPNEDPIGLFEEISNFDGVKDVLGLEDDSFHESQAPSRDVEEQSDDFAVAASLTEKPKGDPKEMSKETSNFDIVKGVIGSEDKEFHGKFNVLASDNPERIDKIPDENQAPSRDEEQSDDLPIVTSLTEEPNEEDDEDRDESLIELNMDKNVENPVQKEDSSAKIEGVTNSDAETISTPSNDLELESSELDQREMAIIHGEISIPDSNGSSSGTEQVLGSSSTGDSIEPGQLSETKAMENPEVSIIIVHESLVEQTELCPEKFESEDGEELASGLSNVTESSNVPSNLGQKNEEVVPTEESMIREDFSESESRSEPVAISDTNLPISNQEVEESEEKSMVVSEETRPIGEEFIHGDTPTHLCEDSVTELESYDSNEIQTYSINLEQEEVINPNHDSPSEEAKASEDHEADAKIGPDSETVPPKLNTENSSEKLAFVEIENQPIGETWDNGEEIIHGDSVKEPESDSIALEEKEVVNPFIDPLSEDAKSFEDHEAKGEIGPSSEKIALIEIQNQISEDHFGDSIFSSKSLIAEIMVSMNEIAYDRAKPEELKRCVEIEKPEEISPDSKAPSRGSVERSSTDSDRESVQYAQMRKSPSFSLDLQSQESEKTPLLFHDKAAITQIRHETAPTQIEEKTVEVERSDSEMSRTPFLGFPKEDEEGNNVASNATPRRQSRARKEAKNGASSSITVTVSSSSSKGEKRRSKSSLFGNCMCCMIH